MKAAHPMCPTLDVCMCVGVIVVAGTNWDFVFLLSFFSFSFTSG